MNGTEYLKRANKRRPQPLTVARPGVRLAYTTSSAPKKGRA